MRSYPYPCELYQAGCIYTLCNGMADVPEIAIPKDDDTIVYRPRCYKLQPPQFLSEISEEDFARAKAGEFRSPTNAVQANDRNEVLLGAISSSQGKSGNGRSKKHRNRGVSEFAGTTTEGFTIDNDSTSLEYKGQTFYLSRGKEWDLVDRIILAQQKRDKSFSVPLQPKVLNAFSDEGKRFVNIFIDREERKGAGNNKFTGLVRLKITDQ